MWKRHFQIISIALLIFSVIIHGEYSVNTSVLSNCHVTINVSSWFISGSCFVSTTFHGYQCYWICDQQRSKEVLPRTLKKQNNGDQYTGICSFSSSLPKQEGQYRYYIFSEPQPTNPYFFNMLINGTDDEKIIKSFFWEENGVKFGNFTCNASSYFPEVRYIWSVPCQSESLINGASVCRTAFEDRRSEVTCIAVYSSGGFTVEDYSKKIFQIVGGGLGMLGILSFFVGIAVYLKRRKGSETTSEVNDHADQAHHTDETTAKISAPSMSDCRQSSEDADFYENVDEETVDEETVDEETVDQETVDQETVDQETVDQETVDQETANASKKSASTPLTKTILFSRMNAVGRPMTYL